MYRMHRDGDGSGRTLTLFFDEPAQRWLRGDWYGLRFLALEAGTWRHRDCPRLKRRSTPHTGLATLAVAVRAGINAGLPGCFQIEPPTPTG